jgi:hypothetical protein
MSWKTTRSSKVRCLISWTGVFCLHVAAVAPLARGPGWLFPPTDATPNTEIQDDIKEECGKFGTIVEVKIPRPSKDASEVPGLGKVWLLMARDWGV